MTKKVTEAVEIRDEWFNNQTIKETIANLKSLAKEFDENAILKAHTSDWNEPTEFVMLFERDETPEERKGRLAVARHLREVKAAAKSRKDEQDLATYEKLKKKFG